MDFMKKAVINNIAGDLTKTGAKHGDGKKPKDKQDDALGTAIDLVQEHVLKEGSQKNESKAEKAKDKKIAKGIKSLFKMATEE